MERKLRDTLNHLGDIVAGSLERFWQRLVSSTGSMTRHYTLFELSRKRQGLLICIGERMAEIKEQSPEDALFNDKALSGLLRELAEVEASIRKKRGEEGAE